MPRPVAVKRPAHTQGSERRNMPKHVGSDPPPDARGAPLHPPGGIFRQGNTRAEKPGPSLHRYGAPNRKFFGK
jgi:hypothetical protein